MAALDAADQCLSRATFPPPRSAEDIDAAFVVKDGNGQKLAYQFAEKPRQSEGVVIQFSLDSAGGLQMRGRFQDQGGIFSYIQPEKRIPANHPLRKIR